ncbi:sensor domain-containing diguanylate cyclase [Roseateles violae]|uniref:Diguanylate cyclase n=1 Tax=Roseateles violae TaxID=3058042 RepID=A0ABT8DZB1_9BURK|nr:diguanylate cyclase [Pelomonas sp. PFR6]MDN3922936.1 diguanylate cyclase [Pelomonas sp. PFR6]
MSRLLGSLKLRLALASALLIAASVAGTVLIAVHEVERRTEEAITDTNLGVAQLAAVLSASVTERQRALAAAAGQWPRGQHASRTAIETFLAQQSALAALFNRLTVGRQAELAPPGRSLGNHVSPPLRGLTGVDKLDLAIVMPLASDEAGLLLAGVLRLDTINFLSKLPHAALLDDAHLQTIVADQRGYVLAHADETRLLSLIEEDPDLRPLALRWRAMGSPLEAAPWAGRFGKQFAAMAAVPGTDWMVFRVADGEAVFGAARRAMNRTIMLAAGVAAAGALAIFGLTAWLLRPMGVLRRRALLALEPAYPPQLGWPEAGGEVGELSRVLKHVGEQLAGSRAAMQQTLQQMEAMLAHAPVGIAFTSEGRIELASKQLEHLLGYGPGELDRPWATLLTEEAPREELHERGETAFREGRSFEAEVPLLRRDGSSLWAHVHGAAVQGNPSRRIWIVSDATASRRQREALTWSATRDPLTELVNRREFETRLAEVVGDRRRRDADCALFIDLDHFKQVNDGAGHAAGDAILKSVAKALQAHVRTGDTVARLGGDEFAVLLVGCPVDHALQIAERMRGQIERDGVCASQPALRVTASIGVVAIAAQHRSLAEVLDAADQACYAAKHAGRNAVRVAAG